MDEGAKETHELYKTVCKETGRKALPFEDWLVEISKPQI